MHKEYIIRPIEKSDLTDLCHLAKESGIGFTSLPESREALADKIKKSIQSFSKNHSELSSELSNEYYMFGLEHITSKKIIGVSAIEANVGANELFYHYKVGQLTKASKYPDIRKEHQILSLSSDLSNSSEICTLFLLPEHRHKFLGKLLSKSRFLFLKQFASRFPEQIIAEMRGASDEQGVSPFWEAIGKHFIGLSFPEADYIKGCGNAEFITNLIPENRVYTCILPKDAQDSIGQVHKFTEPAKILLEREGFKFKGYIDLFDAGPTLHANLHKINSIKNSKIYKINKISNNISDNISDNKNNKITCLISNTKLLHWRALITEAVILDNNQIYVAPEILSNLQLIEGDEVIATDQEFITVSKNPHKGY